MTAATPGNPFGPIATTGACLVCGEPISYEVRGRPRLYCDRVRCRRRGARKRALAAAWEEGLAAEIATGEASAGAPAPAAPTYEDGVRDGRVVGGGEAASLVRLLVDKSDVFIARRQGNDFIALEEAIRLAHRWLRDQADAGPPAPDAGSA